MNRIHGNLKRVFSFLAVFSVLTVNGAAVFAAPQNICRVILPLQSSFCVIEDDITVNGYLPQYLDALAQYLPYADTTFTYSFANYHDAAAMLERGEAEFMFFPANASDGFLTLPQPLGISTYVLCTDIDSAFLYEDFFSFGGMNVGFTDASALNLFSSYARENGFLYTAIKYNTPSSAAKALEHGSVDALLIEKHLCTETQKVISSELSCNMQLMAAEGSHRLVSLFSDAQTKLLLHNPSLVSSLLLRAFNDKGVNIALSKEETNYVSSLPVLRVACPENNSPMTYFDGVNCRGAFVELMEYISAASSLKFEFCHTANTNTAIGMLQNGTADLLLGVYSSPRIAQNENIILTDTIAQTSIAVVGSSITALNAPHLVALPHDADILGLLLGELYPTWKFRYYTDTPACLNAVLAKEADLAAWDNALTAYAIDASSDESLNVAFTDSRDIGVSIGVYPGAPQLLVSVLNKAIYSISSADYNECLSHNTLSSLWPYHYTPQLRAAGILLIIAVLVALVLFLRSLYMRTYRDPLTHLMNNSYLLSRGPKFQKKPNSAIVILDIVQFKRVNASYGIDVGDRVLTFVAKSVSRIGDSHAISARIIADKFAVVTRYSSMDALMSNIRTAMNNALTYTEGSISTFLRYNIGVCVLESGEPFSHFVNMADAARKNAPTSDDGIGLYTHAIREKVKREKEIEDRAKSALDEGEFQVFYQPKFNPKSGGVAGAEALCRRNIPDFGSIAPAEFIPIFERNGFVTKLDFYMLSNVCRLIRQMLDAGVKPCLFSVNQSRLHLSDPMYMTKLLNVTKKYDVDPSYIELEITEYSFEDSIAAFSLLSKVKDAGFKLSIDDFGSGFSSLNMLRAIPLDYIKIDKNFLLESRTSERTKIIIGQIIKMAKSLNISTVCEGVETQEQAEFLTEMDCDAIQGFYFERPMSEKSFIKKYFPDMQRGEEKS
ncbi:MAG: EAL domain-containing protein [Clostridia bacterium]|nr:EAL domain-containing protein [Clostridia bacterium]